MKSLIEFENKFLKLIEMQLIKLDPNKKNLLFLEPYGATLALLKYGLRIYNIILITANTDFRILPENIIEEVPLSLKADTINEAEILEVIKFLHEHISICAVIPGFEYFVPLANKINEWLQLPSISSANILNFRRKDIMRLALKKANIANPKFEIVSTIGEIESAIQRIGWPIICKPVDAAGSVYVKYLDNIKEAKLAAETILNSKDTLWGYRLTGSMLIEEYINGKEYSIEGVVQDGCVSFFSITEKFVADEQEFVEIGHIVNAPISSKVKELIKNYIHNVLKTLGANFCPFHAEIRLKNNTQPILMEIAVRLAGDKIGELISLARGINYFDYVFSAYLGMNKPVNKMNTDYAGIRFFYRPLIASYQNVYGVSVVKEHAPHELMFYYQPHQSIPSFPKPLRRLGHVIMKSSLYHDLCNNLDKIDRQIVFE